MSKLKLYQLDEARFAGTFVPGDFVRVRLEPDGTHCGEAVWLRVSAAWSDDRYTGLLDNTTIGRTLDHGCAISFQPCNVLAVQKEQRH